jgi:predicted nuclease of predicted toxin-antitoxin system
MSPPEEVPRPSFKIDENLPESAAEKFRSAGYDCASIWGQGYSGADDPTVSQICASEDRVLITLDRGFGNIQTYPPGTHPGIIVLSSSSSGLHGVSSLLDQLILLLDGGERVDGNLWVLERNRLRIRGSESRRL